jgi:hypothetical protein
MQAAGARLWLGIAGVLAAATAVLADSRPAGWVAAVLLAGAVILRLTAGRRAGPGPDDQP